MTRWCSECWSDSHDYPDCPAERTPLQSRCLDRPGHPAVYRAPIGTWVSVVWVANPVNGRLNKPQANTSHKDWRDAMQRVWRWYRSGKISAW